MLAIPVDRHSAFSTKYSSILNCEIFRAFGKIILDKTKSRYFNFYFFAFQNYTAFIIQNHYFFIFGK